MTDTTSKLADPVTAAFEKSGLTAAEFDISALTGYSNGSLKRAIWPRNGEEFADAFAALMGERGAGKDAYLAVRDEIRAGLRAAERLQRARRKAEIILRDAGLSQDRERVYFARLRDRAHITRLIEARRAGKVWSSAARAEQAVAAE